MYDQHAVAPWLLKAKAPVDAVENCGMTPLMLASANGSMQTARVLLQNGATCTLRCTDKNYTPLMYAARYGHLDCCRLLVEHASRSLDATQAHASSHAATSEELSTTEAAALARKEGHEQVAAYLDEVRAAAAQTASAQPSRPSKTTEATSCEAPYRTASTSFRSLSRRNRGTKGTKEAVLHAAEEEQQQVPTGAALANSVSGPSAAAASTAEPEPPSSLSSSFLQRASESFRQLLSGRASSGDRESFGNTSVLAAAGAGPHSSTSSTVTVLGRANGAGGGSRWSVLRSALQESKKEELSRGSLWWSNAASRIRSFFTRHEVKSSAVVQL